MTYKILSPFAFAILVVLVVSCSPAKPVSLTAADNGSQVKVNSGDQIVITLDGNPSTGFSWEAKNLDPTMFEQVGEPTFVSSNPGMVGAGGSLTLTFKALKAGTVPLTLIYHRPWETGVEPINTFSVNVIVK